MRCSTATCSSITSSAMEPFWQHLDAEFSRGLKLGDARIAAPLVKKD